jgi:hypothetical protein
VVPHEIVGERRAGARLRFVGSAGESFDGEMLVYEPPSVMELTWGTDRLRIELAPNAAGTVLTLTDVFEDVGKAARDAAGWHECLDRLRGDLEVLTPPAWGDVWRTVHRVYVERFGPDAATLGPPEGYEGYPDANA